MGVIVAGTRAPPFTLARRDGSRFSERELERQRTVLVIYPFAFSPVRTDQLQLYDSLRGELAEQRVGLYGVSCDSTWRRAPSARTSAWTASSSRTSSPRARPARPSACCTRRAFPSAPGRDRPRQGRALELPGALAGASATRAAAARRCRLAAGARRRCVSAVRAAAPRLPWRPPRERRRTLGAARRPLSSLGSSKTNMKRTAE